MSEENLIYNSSDWKTLSFTYVEYPRDDAFGKFMAILALAPLWVGSAFTGLILRCRDLHTIAFFIGVLLNEGLNMTLKYVIREPRPAVRSNYYVEFGMPSSHSQFMFFFTTYTVLFLLKRLHHNSPLEKVVRGVVIALCSIVTALVCYGRIYLLYHTISQVVIGALIGALYGIVWFLFVHVILSPYVFPRIVSWKISELLLIRDTSLIPNILFFEYTATRQECRVRSRKNMKMQ